MLAKIENGAITAWSDAIPKIPDGETQDWRPLVIEYPEHDKRTHQVGNHTDTVEADCVRRTWVVSSRTDLASIKADLKAKIDLDAEAARLKYMTPGSGQALEYREVAEETARYVATSGAGSYPMLQASVSAGEAASLAHAAALVAAREQGWAMIGAEIRRLRLSAKMAVSAAATVEQAAAAAEVVWP